VEYTPATLPAASITTARMMASKRGQEECESIPEDPTKTLQDMASAVREAGDAALLLQRTGFSRTVKAGFYDIVTEGDIASQKVAMGALAKVFPGLPFAAEESDEQAMVPGVPQSRIDADGSIHAEEYIALDPVDGTTNFACGGPDWGVTAAAVRRDTGPTYGVIYLPKKGIMVEAASGHGCKINGEAVNFREDQVLKESIVAAEIGKFVPEDRLQRLLRLVNHCMGIRNLFSSTGNTADVLSGVHGAWVHLKGGSVWDFAAGALAIKEAGGFVCDLQGQPLKWDKLKMEVVFAANEQIAREVVKILGISES
ncbi:unnamed protein product, partial [Ascophyllum nodosum]